MSPPEEDQELARDTVRMLGTLQPGDRVRKTAAGTVVPQGALGTIQRLTLSRIAAVVLWDQPPAWGGGAFGYPVNLHEGTTVAPLSVLERVDALELAP